MLHLSGQSVGVTHQFQGEFNVQWYEATQKKSYTRHLTKPSQVLKPMILPTPEPEKQNNHWDLARICRPQRAKLENKQKQECKVYVRLI